MKITDIKPYLLTTQWTDDPWFPNMLFSTTIVRVETDTGIDGLREITQGYCCGEVVPPLVEYYKRTLIAKDPLEFNRRAQDMLEESVWWAHAGAGRSVISGIETALWDLKGKVLQVPVYQLLGGKMRDRIPVYASGGPAVWPPDENLKKLTCYREQCYRATKLSPDFCELLPGSNSQAVTRIQWVKLPHSKFLAEMNSNFSKIRKEFGGEMELMIDGHLGVETHPISVTEAVEIADALAEFRLRFYEEPLSFTDFDGYRQLKSRSKIPLAAGENFHGLDAFHPWIAGGALHVVQPDVGMVGGIRETVRVVEHAAAFHLTTAMHTGGSMGPALFEMEKYDEFFSELARAPQLTELFSAIFGDPPILMAVELFAKPARVGSEVPHHKTTPTSRLRRTMLSLVGSRCATPPRRTAACDIFMAATSLGTFRMWPVV